MRAVVEVAAWWGLCFGLWIATLSAISWPEVAVSVPVSFACGVLAVACRRVARNKWQLRPAWLLPMLALPLSICTDTVRVLASAVTGPSRTARLVRVQVDGARGNGPRPDGRRALTTVILALSPGSIVVDFEADAGAATVHLLAGASPLVGREQAR